LKKLKERRKRDKGRECNKQTLNEKKESYRGKIKET
jgi:hypothetical protein